MMSRAQYLEYHESAEELARGQADPVATCAGCGGEIYPGETIWVVSDVAIHADPECLELHVAPEEMYVEAWLEIV